MPSPASSIEDKINDIEAECRMRTTKIRQVSRMKDVLQLKDVPLEVELRTRAPEIRGISQLQLAADRSLTVVPAGCLPPSSVSSR